MSTIVLCPGFNRGFNACPADSTFWISDQILDPHLCIVKYCMSPMYDASMFQRGGGGFATMFKNTFQSGFLSILYSIGSKPLQIWDKKVWDKLIKWTACWSLTCKFDSFPGSKWPHQKDHRPGHPKFCARNCRHQRFYHLYHLPSRYRSLCWNSRRDMKFFQIQRKLLGLSFPTLSWSSRTWKSISHLRFR